MSPKDEFAFERLSKAEKVIKALEALARECTGEGLDPFADRIRACVMHCQNDYVALHRALYKQGSGKPPGSTH